MIPLIRNEKSYFTALETLNTSNNNDVDERIADLLGRHSNDLIADLIEHPEHQASFSKIKEKFSSKTCQSSFESIQQDSYIPAILIAKQLQLRKGTKAEFEALQKAGFVSLETKIQGILDPVSVFKALNFSMGGRQLDKARVEKTVDFIKQWIYEASPQDLMNFNSFITGSPTLRDNTTLHCNFYDTEPDHLPTSHSCFNTLDLGINCLKYEDFKAMIETAIASVNNLETSGLEAV